MKIPFGRAKKSKKRVKNQSYFFTIDFFVSRTPKATALGGIFMRKCAMEVNEISSFRPSLAKLGISTILVGLIGCALWQ